MLERGRRCRNFYGRLCFSYGTEQNLEIHQPEEKTENAGVEKNLESTQMTNHITIDDVAKVELVVGTVEHAERVSGSDKLLKLQVNCGPLGMRQILSGVGQTYAPEDLVGKQGVFITNLKPRMMMGLESQGMMLFDKEEAHHKRI